MITNIITWEQNAYCNSIRGLVYNIVLLYYWYKQKKKPNITILFYVPQKQSIKQNLTSKIHLYKDI